MEKVTLSLNKETIAKLNMSEMGQMKGGDTTLPVTQASKCPTQCAWQTCETICINTCADTCICSVGTGMCCQ